MLSICGSIYMNENFLQFVRSVVDGAQEPDCIEFVVVEDEAGSELMASVFERARAVTQRLTVLRETKADRIAHFNKVIGFYEREAIFSPELIAEFRAKVAKYETGEVPRIWFPPGRLYNRAVEAASGDVVLNTPLDLLVHFDLSRIYKEFKAALASRAHLCVFFGLREGNRVRQHGLRMFDRALFDALKESDPCYSDHAFSFEERWFHPAWHEDYWNEKARLADTGARGWEELFGEQLLFSMPDSPWAPEYLCDNMPQRGPYFLSCFKEYLLRKGYVVK